MRKARIWKRKQLDRILGRPFRQGNASEDVRGPANVAIGIARLVHHKRPPPAAKEGVKRWLEWDCYQFEVASEAYRKFLWRLAREVNWRLARRVTNLNDQNLIDTISRSMRSLSTLRRALSCKAISRLGDGGKADEWVLVSTCPKHSGLSQP
jgi:hypothetical protein